MPLFNNLVDLKFSNNNSGFNFSGTSVDLDCEALLKILQRFPCLENLEFLVTSLDLHCLLSYIYSLLLLLIYNDG
jgi:hypothetical protein